MNIDGNLLYIIHAVINGVLIHTIWVIHIKIIQYYARFKHFNIFKKYSRIHIQLFSYS